MTDHRAIMAAQNNADWYSMMFDVHGLQYHRNEIAFLAKDTPPAFHSWMTTLDPDARTDLLDITRQNEYRPKFGIKDSYDCLALRDEGFAELFSAHWIFAEMVQDVDTSQWMQIVTADELIQWESAWKQGGSPTDRRQFPDAILDRSDVKIWGRERSGSYEAGVISNLSTDCVGLSNYFGTDAYAEAATLCKEHANGKLPVVGYERGDDLHVARELGFSTTGTLRVWSRS